MTEVDLEDDIIDDDILYEDELAKRFVIPPSVRWSPGGSLLVLGLGGFILPAVIAVVLSAILSARIRLHHILAQVLAWSLFACGAVFLARAIHFMMVAAGDAFQIGALLAGGVALLADGWIAAMKLLPKNPKEAPAEPDEDEKESPPVTTQAIPLPAVVLCLGGSIAALILGDSMPVRVISGFSLVIAAISLFLNRQGDPTEIGVVQTLRWAFIGCGAAILGLTARTFVSGPWLAAPMVVQAAAGILVSITALRYFAAPQSQSMERPKATTKKQRRPTTRRLRNRFESDATPPMPLTIPRSMAYKGSSLHPVSTETQLRKTPSGRQASPPPPKRDRKKTDSPS
jgi:hypothetical protein